MPTEQGPLGRAMTGGEIQDTVDAFAAAAARGVQAGFDGVQIHAAHGYLLSQFLSPFFNRRADAYGGALDNRARMLIQVVERVREAVGGAYPVLVKVNSEDRLEGGFGRAEMLALCAMVQQAGVDAIEVSGGTILGLATGKPEISFSPVSEKGVYWQDAAEQAKKEIGVPLILVGGIRSFETAETLIESGVADLISLSRPLIREPGLFNRWKAGDRRPAGCISDNACVMAGVKGEGVHCVHIDQ
jgi:2,4-dienoyl-CoA reductase-like NADH-dependent reductase (Old Yellow Enzyme family)